MSCSLLFDTTSLHNARSSILNSLSLPHDIVSLLILSLYLHSNILKLYPIYFSIEKFLLFCLLCPCQSKKMFYFWSLVWNLSLSLSLSLSTFLLSFQQIYAPLFSINFPLSEDLFMIKFSMVYVLYPIAYEILTASFFSISYHLKIICHF